MAGSQNPEHAINAIIAIASQESGGLADELDAIDTEWDDAITLQDPTDYFRGPRRSVALQETKPVVFVEADVSDIPNRYRGENQQASGAGYNLQFHTIQVGVLLQSRERLTYQGRTIDPSEVVNIRIYRTMHALQNLIEKNSTLTYNSIKNADKVLVERVPYPYVETVPEDVNLVRKRGLMTLLVMISP